jgi:hypothetical protein
MTCCPFTKLCNHDVLPLITSFLNEQQLVRLSCVSRTVHRVAETLCIPALYAREISRWKQLRCTHEKRRERWDQTREKLSTSEKDGLDEKLADFRCPPTEEKALEMIALCDAGAGEIRQSVNEQVI